MTDQSNLARLVRDPASGEMVWLKPSTDDLDLAGLPARLDDATLARVESIANSPLPALPSCDNYHLGQSLRMMIAVLPRKQADELSGELFVAAYERQLGHYPEPAISFLCDEAIRTCRWFPTVAECLEILAQWHRNDAAVQRKRQAAAMAGRERMRRDEERRAPKGSPFHITQAEVDKMTPNLVKIGLACGALVEDADGNVKPAPDAA